MDEITYPSRTSTVQPLKFGNGEVISFYTLLGMWLLIHAGLKLNLVSKWSPWGHSKWYPRISFVLHIIFWTNIKILLFIEERQNEPSYLDKRVYTIIKDCFMNIFFLLIQYFA